MGQQAVNKKKKKPIVKLLKLFSLEKRFESKEISKIHISNGVWATMSVEERIDKNNRFQRIYDLQCVVSWHEDLEVGEKRKMTEGSIILLCDEMKLQRLKSMNVHKKRILK